MLTLTGTGALALTGGCLGDDASDDSTDDNQQSDETDASQFDDYDPADGVAVEDAGAVDDEYEFDRPDEKVELDEDITENRTLSADTLHVVTDEIRISSTVTIEPGTVVEFQEDTSFRVVDDGELLADGTEEEPILLTGSGRSPGSWGGVHISSSDSDANLLNYVVVEYGGSGELEGTVHVGRRHREARLTITNCTLRHSETYGLYVHTESDLPDSARNDYVDNAAGPVRTRANNIRYLDGDSDYTGNGEDVVDATGEDLDELDVTWDALNVPYRMADRTRLTDTDLEIEAGATFQFREEAELQVRGDSALVAEGRDDAPLVFTGTEETPGWWNGINVSSSAHEDNRLTNALVEYGGGGEREGSVHVGRRHREARLTMTNCTLRHSESYGLYVHTESDLPDSGENIYTDNEDGAVRTRANNIHYLDGGSDYTGNGEDVIDVTGEDLDELDVTWDALNVPYRMAERTRLSDTDLEIEAGATFQFREEAELLIRGGDGAFVAEGTDDAPIIFTGTEETPGWWDGIYVVSSAHEDNTLDNVVVEYGGGGEREGNVHVGRRHREAFVSISNSTLRNSDSAGLWVHADSTVNDEVCDVNEFENNAGSDCELE